MVQMLKRVKSFFEDSMNKFFNLYDMEYENYSTVLEELEEILQLDDEIIEKHFKNMF